MASLGAGMAAKECTLCKGIYNNTHILKCLHVYCNGCLQELRNGNKVQCFQCGQYTNMKKIQNYKNVPEIDATHAVKPISGNQTKTTKTWVCDVCRLSGKDVISCCKSCDEFLCPDCDRAHRGSKLTKEHKLTSLDELHQQKLKSVQQDICNLQSAKTEIDQRTGTLQMHLNSIQDVEVQQIADINKFRKHLKDQIDQHHDQLIDDIQSANRKVTEPLTSHDHRLMQESEKLAVRIHLLGNLLEESKNCFQLIEHLKNVNVDEELDLQHICSELQPEEPVLASPIMVVEGEAWNPEKSTRLEAVTFDPDWQAGYENSQLFRKEIHPQYHHIQSLDVAYPPYKLRIYNNELWVCGDAIYVYNLDLKPIRNIENHQLKSLRSLVKTETGDIIVSDFTSGLHLLTEKGVYLSCIVQGNFSDVALMGNDLYALEFQKCKVCIFRREVDNQSWNKQKEFALDYKDGFHLDKIYVLSSCIYITSGINRYFSIYSLSGQFIAQLGQRGMGEAGYLNYPYVSDVDSKGDVLVCDSSNQKLQIYHHNKGGWWSNHLELEGSPLGACVDETYMWVGSHTGNYRLDKYVKG